MFSRLKTIATIALAVVAVASSAAAIASFVASPAAGNAAGALCATRAGGTEAFLDREHREVFLRQHAPRLLSSDR